MSCTLRIALVVACVASSGCVSGPTPAAPSPGAGAAPADARPLDAPVALPPAFIVSTNEPFWQVTVSGGSVLLVGIDARRSLMLESNEPVFDGRLVMARDASGTVEVRVAGRACQDSMSGAWFPYTARVVLSGAAPISGCARGVEDPLPRP